MDYILNDMFSITNDVKNDERRYSFLLWNFVIDYKLKNILRSFV